MRVKSFWGLKRFWLGLTIKSIMASCFSFPRFGKCSSIQYNVVFENSTLLIGEQRRATILSERFSFRGEIWIKNTPFIPCVCFKEEPFYLKEVYLQTDCSDCLLAHEEVVSGNDTFTSLLFFSKKRLHHSQNPAATWMLFQFNLSLLPGRTQSVSPAALETLKRQAECLRMPSPIMLDPDYGKNETNTHCGPTKAVLSHFECWWIQKSALTTSRPWTGSPPSTLC